MTTALLRLVPIGKLRNGRVLYMPEPELCLIDKELLDCANWFVYRAFSERGELYSVSAVATRLENELLDQLVDDQQRVWDGIVYGEMRPFEPRELPAFAQILRMGV